jgi:NAD(P)-dependent dehydrogenase (short-subunit alcohol dehydrogenase family)
MYFPKNLLDGSHIIVSGGAGSLGVAIVKGLLEHGARVSVNDVLANEDAVARFVQAGINPQKLQYLRGDLRESAEVERFLQLSRSQFGPIHTALCHAGVVTPAPLIDVEEHEWERTIDISLKSAFLLGKGAAKRMIEDRVPGQLIFTSSWVAQAPWPDIGPYNTSKAGMNQLMKSFARELAPARIRANAIAPGIVSAGMAKAQWESDSSYRARAQKAIPLGFMQPLDSVVNAFLFLCSGAASYMTGSVLLVDGGCSLYPMD